MDEALLDSLIAAYVVLIKSLLDSADPRRFNRVMSLAAQAAEIDSLCDRTARVEDFDGVPPAGGFRIGQAIVGNALGVRGGDNMELLRTMIGALSNIGAALDTFYTVGQHSLFVAAMMEADGCTPRECLAGLLHDRGEFPRGDIPTDWKTDADRETEAHVEWLCLVALGIASATGAFTDEERALVKRYDHEAVVVEGNIVAPLCLEKMPEKYVNPELVAKRVEIFRQFYVRDPVHAFSLNWYEHFPDMFAAMFDRLKEAST